MGTDIAGYASITAICFLVGLGFKASPISDKFIPIIVGACGAGLGLWAYLAGVPEFAANVLDGIARGAVSGLAATGVHQIGKQLSGNANDDATGNDNNTDG